MISFNAARLAPRAFVLGDAFLAFLEVAVFDDSAVALVVPDSACVVARLAAA